MLLWYTIPSLGFHIVSSPVIVHAFVSNQAQFPGIHGCCSGEDIEVPRKVVIEMSQTSLVERSQIHTVEALMNKYSIDEQLAVAVGGLDLERA